MTPLTPTIISTFGDPVDVRGALCVDDLVHQLVVAALPHGHRSVLHLGVHQPTVVQRDAQQVEDDALRGVLEITDPAHNGTTNAVVLRSFAKFERHCTQQENKKKSIIVQSLEPKISKEIGVYPGMFFYMLHFLWR